MIDDVEAIRIESRPQWLQLRKKDVTASDIAAVCGVHPYSSALQVWADKMDITTVEENNAMQRGRWLEDGVINALREAHPDWVINKPGAYLRSPSLRIGCTPDAWAKSPEGMFVIQCKVVARSVFERDWVDGPPLYYQLQTLTEAKLSNMPRAKLAALVISEFGADLEEFDVPLIDAAWAKCCSSVDTFWNLVAKGQKPAADYGKDADVIGKIYRANAGLGEPIDLSHDNRAMTLAEKYQQLGKLERDTAAERKAVRAEIVEKLGGARIAKLGTWKITNTPVHIEPFQNKGSDYDRLTVTAPKG